MVTGNAMFNNAPSRILSWTLLRLGPRVRSALNRLVNIFYHVPIVGGLAKCGWSDHGSAIKELGANLVFATAAFWITTLILHYGTDALPWSDAFTRSISKGELFIFSVSLVGPIFYVALEDPEWAKREFPNKMWHAVVVTVFAIVSAVLFSQIRSGASPKVVELVDLSFWLSVFAIVLRYLTIVYNKARRSPIDVRRGATSSFREALDRHHTGDL